MRLSWPEAVIDDGRLLFRDGAVGPELAQSTFDVEMPIYPAARSLVMGCCNFVYSIRITRIESDFEVLIGFRIS